MEILSIELDDQQAAALRRVAEVEGRSEADIAREAIVSYARARHPIPSPSGDPRETPAGDGERRTHRRIRTFAMIGSGEGPGGSIADIPDEDLLKGFGE